MRSSAILSEPVQHACMKDSTLIFFCAHALSAGLASADLRDECLESKARLDVVALWHALGCAEWQHLFAVEAMALLLQALPMLCFAR